MAQAKGLLVVGEARDVRQIEATRGGCRIGCNIRSIEVGCGRKPPLEHSLDFCSTSSLRENWLGVVYLLNTIAVPLSFLDTARKPLGQLAVLIVDIE
jgi:hypothetical protein